MKPWILDSHCDTITKLMDIGGNLYRNSGHLDIERMNKSQLRVQFFAAWIAPQYCPGDAIKQTLKIIDKFYRELEYNQTYIELACSYDDIIKNQNNNKLSAVLTIEGGEALEGDLSVLRIFYRLGVRAITLTWNYRNQIADGVKDESSNGGLTPFGVEVIKEMNRLKMMIDISHLSEAGFWDVVRYSNAPIFASHSNTRAVCSHPRNLKDEQIKAVAEKEGIIGINFYPAFVKEQGKVNVKDIVEHINYIRNLIGIDYIGLGGDFDGIDQTPVDISDITGYENLFYELRLQNYSMSDIDKIFNGNYMKFIKKVIG